MTPQLVSFMRVVELTSSHTRLSLHALPGGSKFNCEA